MKYFPHQLEAVQRGSQGNLGILHEPGLGKTLTALTCANRIGGQALVVCPLSIIESAWIADCNKFFPRTRIVSLHDSNRTRRLKTLAEKADIYVVNYDTLKSIYRPIAARGFDTILVDESSAMKNFSAEITKALLCLAGLSFKDCRYNLLPGEKPIPHRYILSGTPAPNDESDYWSQVTFLAPGKCFPSYFYAFRNQYFTGIKKRRYDEHQPAEEAAVRGRRFREYTLWQFRPEMRQQFMEAIQPVVHVVRKKDALDLPEQVHQIRNVELSPPERTAYRLMVDHLRLDLLGGEIVAKNALHKSLALREITSGFAYDGHQKAHYFTQKPGKLKELLRVLEEIPTAEQVIVWATFVEEIQLLLRTLPNAVALYGATSDRHRVVQDFQAGTYRILVANPQAAGHGLTLHNDGRCSTAIYYSMDYSYERHEQSLARIHRIGQKNACLYIYLLAGDTIDHAVYQALRKKQNLSDTILNYLKHRPGGDCP